MDVAETKLLDQVSADNEEGNRQYLPASGRETRMVRDCDVDGPERRQLQREEHKGGALERQPPERDEHERDSRHVAEPLGRVRSSAVRLRRIELAEPSSRGRIWPIVYSG